VASSGIVRADERQLGWLQLRQSFTNEIGNFGKLSLSVAWDRIEPFRCFRQVLLQFRVKHGQSIIQFINYH
jgi:hypothetical protein